MIMKFLNKLSSKISGHPPIEKRHFPHALFIVILFSVASVALIFSLAFFVIVKIFGIKNIYEIPLFHEGWIVLARDFGNTAFFLVGFLLALYGVVYSVMSYRQAKKVEEQIRSSLSSYRAFVVTVTEILATTSKMEPELGEAVNVKLVLWFPYYMITKDMGELGKLFHEQICEYRRSAARVTFISAKNPFDFAFEIFETAANAGALKLDSNMETSDDFLNDLRKIKDVVSLDNVSPGLWLNEIEREYKCGPVMSNAIESLGTLLTPRVPNYSVVLIDNSLVDKLIFQLVWTHHRAAVVFLPPSEVFKLEVTRAYGFVTEDNDMIEVIRQMAIMVEQMAPKANLSG